MKIPSEITPPSIILEYSAVHRGAFCRFLSGGFFTAIVVTSPERKLAKRTSVQCLSDLCYTFYEGSVSVISAIPSKRYLQLEI